MIWRFCAPPAPGVPEPNPGPPNVPVPRRRWPLQSPEPRVIPPWFVRELRTLIARAEYVPSVFCITVTVTSIPVFKSVAVSVAWRIIVVWLVNVACTLLPWKLVTDKLLLLILWIVPVVTVRHAFAVVDVFEVALLVAALALPQAASSVVSNTKSGTAKNFHLLRCLTIIFSDPFTFFIHPISGTVSSKPA